MRTKRRPTLPRVFALGRPLRRQDLEVMVAGDQVVGDAQDGGPQRPVADADQWSVGLINLVALIAERAKTGPSGDALGVGVMFDRPGFTGEVGGADDIDAGEGQEQEVRRVDEPAGNVAFQGLDFLGFSPTIIVQRQDDAPVLVGGDVAGCGLGGPVEDGLHGALLEADVRLPATSDRGVSPAAEAFRGGKFSTNARPPGCPRASEAGGEAGSVASRWSRI